SSLDLGNIQNKVIGYNEKIFEVASELGNQTPEKLVEIWCVDSWTDAKYEILSYYSHQEEKAETEFYSYSDSLSVHKEVNLTRVTNGQSVYLKSQYFDLKVDKNNLGSKSGTFLGDLNIYNSKDKGHKVLECRLGGYLDARIWPVPVVNYDHMSQLEWDPVQSLFYFISGTANLYAPNSQEYSIYRYSPLNQQRENLTPGSANTYGVSSFQLSKDKSSLFFMGKQGADVAIQLYTQSLVTPGAPLRLNSYLPNVSQSASRDITISPDGNTIFYMDGFQENAGDSEPWLRSVNMSTGAITQISHDLPLSGDYQVNKYDVLFSIGKVVYVAGNYAQELWLANIDGSNRRKIDLSSELGSKYILLPTSALKWKIFNERYLVLSLYNNNSVEPSSLLLVVDLVSEKPVFSKVIAGAAYTYSISGLSALGIVVQYPSAYRAYLNVKNLSLVNQAELMNYFSQSSDAAEKQAALEFASNFSDGLCDSQETLIKTITLNTGKQLVVNKKSDGQVSLYLKSISNLEGCKKLGVVDVAPEILSRILSSPLLVFDDQSVIPVFNAKSSADEKNILLKLDRKLFLIPTDNRPIIEIYSGISNNSIFYEIGFIGNSKVFFRGSLIDSSIQLFVWDIPYHN
ncbi:MAG: hypothetical protein KDD50_15375, partial [Bdellovibrionales bacterium]|nr:hypothetical protein [Bdellovibrionales bacterium]